ncbi:hypothetical protein GKC30_03300 [Pseudodesulfovibrio sp. F-1]|uniref:Carboxypeptidase regulatory-like domain-containing protein n=1 Tax=Pseudodesulfovibrio alkaliphilus TaxID=2661613 RepID=A0A7K1KKP5_9BACT|nr:hypothetical protein [Pseudodesulfovibrio alkaliphilus]MUM76656.1 hypothetical protein [Pseudodesulfovibrio alkaliphilus]
MTRRHILPAMLIVASLLIPASAMAHAAICSCFDNGDNTITCEGGFSDGSSAAGVRVFVRDANDTTVARGAMNDDSEFTFDKPAGAYTVLFDAGPGHQVEIQSRNIVQ